VLLSTSISTASLGQIAAQVPHPVQSPSSGTEAMLVMLPTGGLSVIHDRSDVN
jgi:hypothetical protein